LSLENVFYYFSHWTREILFIEYWNIDSCKYFWIWCKSDHVHIF
jgi:hypothetical protein